ncbi:MAG: DUF2189 domain-containing protein [Alphaproteobacteria bacterium]
MAEDQVSAAQNRPQIRRIGPRDLGRALGRGWNDFQEKPTHAAVIGIVYPVLGLLLFWWILDNELLPLVFPLVSGFALLGPFAALIFYEISRRMEEGKPNGWEALSSAFRSAALGPIAALALILAGLFIVWIWTANVIYETIMPRDPESVGDFMDLVFGTPEGTRLIVVGCLAGAVFAAVAFIISVVSFPLLLDRHVSTLTAIGTSVRAVTTNPVSMMLWGLIVVTLLVLGAIPLLVGLSVAVPVLGHATWHLYRAVVES